MLGGHPRGSPLLDLAGEKEWAQPFPERSCGLKRLKLYSSLKAFSGKDFAIFFILNVDMLLVQ